MWEHYDDLPFEVFCTDKDGQRHLISRHSVESEAVHSTDTQNRSGGYAAEYHDWRKVELERGSANMVSPVDAVLPQVQEPDPEPEPVIAINKMREVKCILCNDCGTAQSCPACHKVDPYMRAYEGSLVNDTTGDPNS